MSNQQLLGAFGALQQSGDLDLTSVNTERPVIAGGSLVKFRIADSKAAPGAKDPNKVNWVLTLETLEPTIGTKEQQIPAGFKITTYTGLSATEKRTTDMIVADVVRNLDAIYGKAVSRTIKLNEFDLASVIGGEVVAKVSVDPEKENKDTGETQPEQNRLRLLEKQA